MRYMGLYSAIKIVKFKDMDADLEVYTQQI